MTIISTALMMPSATRKNNDNEPINVFLGSITSTGDCEPRENSLRGLNSHPDKIYATVKVNELHDSTKVDTGADTCVITTTDLQQFPINILPSNNVLRGYGGSKIEKNWCSSP